MLFSKKSCCAKNVFPYGVQPQASPSIMLLLSLFFTPPTPQTPPWYDFELVSSHKSSPIFYLCMYG